MKSPFDPIVYSYLDWWTEAGLTGVCRDTPQSWIAAEPVAADEPAAKRITRATTTATPTALNVTGMVEPMPDTLIAFDEWITSSTGALACAGGATAVPPAGPSEPAIMIVADFPAADDVASSILSGGPEGMLLRGMLAAIDVDVTRQRRATIALARPPHLRIDHADAARLLPLMLHQIALVRPRTILLLGAQCHDIMIGGTTIPDAEGQPFVNPNGAKTEIFAVHHPRMLIDRPALKRHAWEILKRLREYI